jgi:hypothetical protein
LITLTRDVETEDFLLAQKDKKTLENYVENEQKQRHNNGKKSTNTFASTSPQACPTITPLLELASMLATTSSHIPLVTRTGRQATWLAQFNQGTHFYYKIQLQLQIIRILLQGIICL